MTSRAPLVAAIAAFAFFAGITGVRLAYTLAYVLVALLGLAFGWSRILARRLDVRRQSPTGSFMVGEPYVERFVVTNRAPLPLPYCEVGDAGDVGRLSACGRAFALPAGGTVRWTVRGTFPKRGIVRFGPTEVRLGDPFGLFTRRLVLASTSSVVVYPVIHPIGDIGPLGSGTSIGESRHGRPADVPPDVATIREYDPSDGMGRIHWATTARTGRLMSRTYDTRQGSDLLLALDLERGHGAGEAPESTLEYAVSLAASIAHAALRRGQAVALVTNDANLTAIGAGRGEAQRQRILEYLATASDDGRVSITETIHRHGSAWRGRGAMVVVTSNRDPAWVEALLDAGVRGRRHLAVVVEPVSFGAPGAPFRILAAWRLAIDWWLVRRGDDLATAWHSRAVG